MKDNKRTLLCLISGLCLSFLAAFLMYSSFRGSQAGKVIEERQEALSQNENPDVFLYCRCHIALDTCYGGNAISLRPLCGSGINLSSCSDVFVCP